MGGGVDENVCMRWCTQVVGEMARQSSVEGGV